MQPKTFEQVQRANPFYLTCLHLDYKYEPYRLKEIDVITKTIESLISKADGNNNLHIWAGDFNSLTKEDYTPEEWEEITRVRRVNCWERPHVDVTTKVK